MAEDLDRPLHQPSLTYQVNPTDIVKSALDEGGSSKWAQQPVVMPVPERRDAPRPDRDSGWGRTATLTTGVGTDRGEEVARVQLDTSESMTLSIDVVQAPGQAPTPSGGTINLHVWALVEFGNGSAAVTKRVLCDYRVDTPVVGTWARVSVYIGDSAGAFVSATQVTTQPQAQVTGQISRGIRGTTQIATQFVSGATDLIEQLLIVGPARLASIQAHRLSAGAGDLFLQLYDLPSDVIPAGSKPKIELALGTTPSPEAVLRWLNPIGFSQGVVAAVSTTSGFLTAAAQGAWMTVEQVQL